MFGRLVVAEAGLLLVVLALPALSAGHDDVMNSHTGSHASLIEAEPLTLSPAESGMPMMGGGMMGPGGYGPQREPEQAGVNLLELAWRARWLILLCTLIGGGAGWAILQRVVPRYTSMSRVYVERNLPQLLTEQLQVGQSTSYLYTQAELMQSTPVLAAVIENPANQGLETFKEVDNPIAFLHKALDVVVGQNDEIINVMLELPNAKEAAQLVNSIVEQYSEIYARNRRDDTSEVLAILRDERNDRERDLKETMDALEEFRRLHAELAVQIRNENIVTNRFALLSEELNRTEISLLEAKALYNRVKKMYDTPTLRPFLLEMAMGDGARGGPERGEQSLLALQNQVQDLELRLTSEQALWGDGHPRVELVLKSLEAVQKRLADKEQEIVDDKATLIEGYVQSVQQQYELLDHKRNELQASYDSQFTEAKEMSSHAQQLVTLQENVQRAEKALEIVDERIKELNLTERVGAINVSVMETAGISPEPSYPSRPKFLALGTLLGGLCGFGLAWLRDLLDHRLKSVDEIASVMQLPVLGALQHQGTQKDRSKAGRIVLDQPRSTAAEAFRTLRTAVHFGLAGDDCKTLAVTSPSPGDGKSTVTSNLAIATALADRRTLLIDADMRKPTQHRIFSVEGKRGLADVLTERIPVDDVIIRGVQGTPLDLLPCGTLPANPVELLNNGFFAALLEDLCQRYDRVIIDSPPVMPVADARVIGAMVDAVLLVLRAERSTRRLSVAARNELWQVRAMRLGVVINGVPTRKAGAYYGYSYGYGYGGYGSYGYSSSSPYGQVEDKRPKRRRGRPGTVVEQVE
jgi:capsular exopolysaccharide synthesis family protein